jgi:hypothetical protein
MAPRSKMIKSEASVATSADADKLLKHKRRYCRAVDCTRIVKSQGLCQRHGAKPRQCRVECCGKQAQGNFNGMCKSHFKAQQQDSTPLSLTPYPILTPEPPPTAGESVYDGILPASHAWNPVTSAGEMPLIEHFKQGFHLQKPPAWHRNEERRARGLWPVENPAVQFEGWERELVWMEILLLTGTPESSFRRLARGWGRDEGFHMVLSHFICDQHGDIHREKRERAHAADGRGRRPDQAKNIGTDFWGAIYGDADYNEVFTADLTMFDDDLSVAGGQHMHVRNSFSMSRSLSFILHEENYNFCDAFDCSSSAGFVSDDSSSHNSCR